MLHDKLKAALKQSGYKITRQRLAVLRAIALSNDLLTPSALHERVRKEQPDIGLVTIYRTLDILAGLGLICKIHTEANSRSYISGVSEHHGHLICSSCGKVVDFKDHKLDELEKRLSIETGF